MGVKITWMWYNKINQKTIKGVLYNGLLEGAIACLVVIGFVLILTKIATHNSHQPNVVHFESDIDEVILSPYNAIITGELQLRPMELEDQRHNFSYMDGRALLKERKVRYVSNWTDLEAVLSWEIDIAEAGPYELAIYYLNDKKTGGIGEFICNNQSVVFDSNQVGSEESLIQTKIGVVTFTRAGTYHCTLKALDITDNSFIMFKSIIFQKTKSIKE